MKFTVCIPTYNRAYCIKTPLDSLVAQTFKDFEVLVVDDGSSDNTEDVVEAYKSQLDLKYFKKTNGGKHTALNVGLDHAEGDLFVILDSDDEFPTITLERMNAIWEKRDKSKALCGVIGRSASDGKVIGRLFGDNQKYISYVEFHYGEYGGEYGDCCECVRTDLIAQHRWPEFLDTKFVPENYVNDLLGINYQLITTNEIFSYHHYMEDGITLNADDYYKKNLNGYLFNAVSKVVDIVPFAKRDIITSRTRLILWSNYWHLVDLDRNNKGPRVPHVSIWGGVAYLYYHFGKIINSIMRRIHHEL